MSAPVEHNARDVQRAFRENERAVWIRNFRVASILAFIFIPAGSSLDAFVYPGHFWEFLKLRLVCSGLLLFIWWFVTTPIGQRNYRVLGWILPALPTFFISWMIARTEGASSPYYAGLNLVLLGAAMILRWTLLDSIIVFLEVMCLYLAACIAHGSFGNHSLFFNNFYFLSVTGVFLIIGIYFYNRLRFREFALRYELDRSRTALEETNQKLVELDQLKNRFFANISHELRTPLTLLLAPLETLLQKFNESIDAKTREMLVAMHSNGMRLLKLINDLLDLVRMESGRMEVKSEPLRVSDFVKGLAAAARQVADDKRLQLDTYVDPDLGSVMADRDKLEKIVLNLVFNALKFTPPGGRVDLRAEQQGFELVITVTDTGMGISEKNLPFVFDRFWQADSSSRRKHQGVGIGLALVKELTEIQAGSVSVKSQEGKGTEFCVRLPLHKIEEVPVTSGQNGFGADSGPQTVSSEEWLANLYRRAELFPAITPSQEFKAVELVQNNGRPKALIADDEPDMLRFLKSQLIEEYDVFEAVDGLQAVEKAGQFLPDIVLLDMMMPEKDGLQVCREIREQDVLKSVPIILLTARADEETKLAALEAGASDFLPKPFSTTELHVRIRNLVESHQFQRKLSKQNQALESTIEQLKETEIQLVQNEKLASLGRMSAGIIHEINNPLNFATTGLFTLRNKAKHLPVGQQEEYSEVLKDVEEGLKRVKTIVSDLRMFTHPNTEQVDPVDVADVVAASLRFLSSEWKDRVKMEQEIAPGQTILANKNKLIHVITNLLQNALDAMKTKAYEGEVPAIRILGRVENGISTLSIRDNGPGIDPEHVDKIFDPFFTTKDVGEGMGLGLSICYRIVREYEGKIRVNTELGKFCEFALEFPMKG